MTESRVLATGGFIQFGDGPQIAVEGCTFLSPERIKPAEVVKLDMNFELGFTMPLSLELSEAGRALGVGLPVDPHLDEEWEAWRCPGCGKSRAKAGRNHWWRANGETATCSGQRASEGDA